MGIANKSSHSFLSFILLLCHIVMQSQYCTATDTLSQSQNISVGEILTSAGQIFELGFFRPGNSSKQYVGIWYKKISARKVVWVANREEPLAASDSTSSLTIGGDGNLRLVDGNKNIVWSSNISVKVNHSVAAVLLDNGNLVLKDSVSGDSLWESFNHPCDTVLPGMMIGLNTKTGEKSFLSSWQREDDPSPGKFVVGITPESSPQLFVWKGSIPLYRSGQWNGFQFVGIPHTHGTYQSGLHASSQIHQDNQYFTFNVTNSSDVRIMDVTSNGAFRFILWDQSRKAWYAFWNTTESPCDMYGACGPFGVCNKNKSPICSCFKGFVPKSNEEWINGNWTSGCVRRTGLLCDKSLGNSSSGSGKIDGFLKFGGMKLPDLSTYVQLDNAAECELWCLNNCSCLAYAYVTGIGCTIWAANLLDIQEFALGGQELFLRLANSELGKEGKRAKLIISFAVISGTAFLAAITYALCWWKANRRGKREKRGNRFHFSDILDNTRVGRQGNLRRNGIRQQDPSELPMFELEKIVDATNNFSTNNKLGEGGFGPVFKGKLEDGQEIAVKKLSRCSGQGVDEFKNEIILISKLQHKNLVRLLGCCIEGEELLIVYEYMPNRSLDTLLFDQTRRAQLDWARRFNIIQGIARGLLYLHRDSCLKIIHRDLKVSNILLDKDMNPKISDFGLARIFQGTQELANTRRVVGTYGYMSPEYALGGIFSEKSDVFSFGVLLLEIVSGKKNTSFQSYHEKSLLGYAWQLWNEGKALDLLDQVLVDSFSLSEVMRCIHVGLLCVQDHATDRPTMSVIILLLTSETEGPQPKQPTFTFQKLLDSDPRSQSNNICSINEITVSTVTGR